MISQHEQNIVTVDATHKPCPLPLLMLKRAIKENANQQIQLIASDANSEVDILRFCQLRKIKCIFNQISDTEFHYTIDPTPSLS